uniref:RNA-directed RNA polymerase n=1 Tax=Nanning Totiv tick virus 4 TaxID=2972359 RepID=A0A9E8AAR7_9VIRU|nr:MAG: polyprotein [Nanning Totiv tick virus 4]
MCRVPTWATPYPLHNIAKTACCDTMTKLRMLGIDDTDVVVNGAGELFIFVHVELIQHTRKLAEPIAISILLRTSPATVPAEFKRKYVLYWLDCSRIAERQVGVPQWAFDHLCSFDSYERAPVGLREIYQVHPVFVAKWRKNRVHTLWQIYSVNKSDMVDYELAGVFCWWSCLPDALYARMLSTQLHLVQLSKNAETLSLMMEICRQQASIGGHALDREAFYWIRKYKNLTGRRKGICDVELERSRMYPSYSYRVLGRIGYTVSRLEYLSKFASNGQRVADMLVSRIVDMGRIDTIEKWWERRINNVASGSSSNRHLLDPYIKLEPEITDKDRPNKKSVMEVVPVDYYKKILSAIPCMIARRSTKNEPGRKQRALYAVNDEAVIISAYASQSAEKAMNFWGMCPLQRPIDVLQWWKDARHTHAPNVWLSADYSDFNKEHSTIELSLLNLFIAKAWCRKMKEGAARRAKVACSVWVALSQWNRYVKTEEGELQRIFSGLFSGSRDTARDNTLLHCIYNRIIVEWLDENIPNWGQIVSLYMCGDDEDVKLSDMQAAAYYYFALTHLGWHANDAKQMCGLHSHEFLQKFPHDTKGCIGPISSMIAALCSGQWYVKPGMQQDNAIAALSDQMWELVVRGADIEFVYHLAIDLLNDYMQVRPGPNTPKKKLEWWKFRLHSQEIPPQYLLRWQPADIGTRILWKMSSDQTDGMEKPPQTFFYSQRAAKLPHLATQSWCNRWFKLFQEYGKEHMFPQYIKDMKANSYGSLFHTSTQKEKRKWLLEQWPSRSSITLSMHATVTQKLKYHHSMVMQLHERAAELLLTLEQEGDRTVPETTAQILAKNGADTIMYELLGGSKNHELRNRLGLLSYQRTPGLSWLQTKGRLYPCCMLLDPALRSFLHTTGPD